ncbi:MAG: glutamyl-tRNA reductase [Gammaproteobacteria bacterium RIFCSPHIGHO2_12_FULL_37_34]|nr:MAG: glutamyl-tRNA reductase [Gammaproteobacteria bacterium RIFCSPHIGHO2_12_FULL_37_34]
MTIFVIGINHKTAPVHVRERIYFALDKHNLYLRDLLAYPDVHEAMLLSTCNRSELYCDADHLDRVREWFCAQATALFRSTLKPHLYLYRDEKAIAHIMRVACGLDSMIVGESQIFGQMKEAFSESCTAGAVGTLFYRLFQQIFTMVKEIRTTTSMGACPVSVASAAIHFAKQTLPHFPQANIVLIGAGSMSELLLRYLTVHHRGTLTLVNRSIEHALPLLVGMKGNLVGLDQLESALIEADIVLSATGSVTPLITQKTMLAVMRTRAKRSFMLIDIAVPRDIESSVAEIEGVHLFCIDDLKTIIENNRQDREHATNKVREMIDQKSIECMGELQSIDHVQDTIRVYREQIEALCRVELVKAKQQLQQGVDPSQVLDEFARVFTKKLLHVPSVQLRQAGMAKRFELLSLAKQLFAIPESKVERL